MAKLIEFSRKRAMVRISTISLASLQFSAFGREFCPIMRLVRQSAV
jgi:hypothetical protein